jgi:preprotein translocase subunit SecG
MSDPGSPQDPNAPGWGAPQPGPGQPPPPPAYGQQPGYGAPPGWGAQPPQYGGGYGGGYGAPQTDGKAIGALVAAIASFVICPFVPAVVALILVSQSKHAIAASGGRLGGEGMLTAAKIVAWINIALCVLFFLVLLALGLAGAHSASTS